ncbi:MAG: hypothetical protein ACRECO_02825 [Xanthobacteraceae bacterium]
MSAMLRVSCELAQVAKPNEINVPERSMARPIMIVLRSIDAMLTFFDRETYADREVYLNRRCGETYLYPHADNAYTPCQ